MSTHAETLGDLDVYQHVTVTLDDGTTLAGRANPIDYMPEQSLRLELEPDDEENVRYQFTASYDGEWEEVRAQRVAADDEDWNDIGTVTEVEPEETEGESEDAVGAGK